MDLRKTNAQLTILLLLLFAAFYSSASNQENPLVKAIKLFEEGNFVEAEQEFKSLLDAKPDHLMVNYYYGACRTENGYYGTNEIVYLLNGSIGESPLKTDYYIAVQYHAKNRWDDALKHYNRFKGKITKEEQKKLHLSERIQQCYEKVNPFIVDDVVIMDVLPVAVPREKEIEEYNPATVADSVVANQETYTIVKEDTLTGEATIVTIAKAAVVPKKTIQKTEPINFVINSEITYLDSTNFRTKSGLNYYSKGIKKQKELDVQLKRVDDLRAQYGSTNSYSEKQEIGAKILKAERENYELQHETNSLLSKAKLKEGIYWETAPTEEKAAFLQQLDDYLNATQELAIPEMKLDTTTLIEPTTLFTGPETAPLSEEKSGDELIYKIQLGAYSRELPTYVKNLFKKLSYIRKIENYTDEKGIVVYTTGNLTNYEDALKMQHQVKQEGVEDAFVVPYFNGKRITLKEAKEIEAGK